MKHSYSGAQVFDGTKLHDGLTVTVEDGVVTALDTAPGTVHLNGGIIAPGFVDLQVNGGAGLMVSGTTTTSDLRQICAAHLGLGTAGILPTLITDTPQATAQVIAAGIAAIGTPGFLGLHLEGPHLDQRRKGAHDTALIRPMEAADLARICDAARALPALMLTVAPESVTVDQIATLTAAGVIVSLGHSDCSYDTARAAMAAGARCATHLFNAMSQLGNREPGLTGAVLEASGVAGMIADGIHVHPATMRLALAAKPEGIFLVSDCMAFAGTDLAEITLGGRRILRQDGRLTLEDGTLAGADLTLPQAVATLITQCGVAAETALAMATSRPAFVIGNHQIGHIAPGQPAMLVHLPSLTAGIAHPLHGAHSPV